MQENQKFTPCFGKCGAVVEWKTTKRVYCNPCRLEKKRATARAVMARKRIAKGISPVKGVVFACSVCGVSYVRYVAHSHRCESCQLAFYTERTRAESRKRKTDAERREKYNAHARKVMAEQPSKRISAHFKVLMHRALGKGKGKAGRSWRTFVDYTLEDLVEHLERQFSDGMSWENQGEWHIDHIIPQASFRYDDPGDDEFKRCWALSNLRPLWGSENIRKQAKRLFLL